MSVEIVVDSPTVSGSFENQIDVSMNPAFASARASNGKEKTIAKVATLNKKELKIFFISIVYSAIAQKKNPSDDRNQRGLTLSYICEPDGIEFDFIAPLPDIPAITRTIPTTRWIQLPALSIVTRPKSLPDTGTKIKPRTAIRTVMIPTVFIEEAADFGFILRAPEIKMIPRTMWMIL